jgi:D-mannonate dehydratase
MSTKHPTIDLEVFGYKHEYNELSGYYDNNWITGSITTQNNEVQKLEMLQVEELSMLRDWITSTVSTEEKEMEFVFIDSTIRIIAKNDGQETRYNIMVFDDCTPKSIEITRDDVQMLSTKISNYILTYKIR